MPILRTAAFGLTPECFPYEVDVDDSVEAQRNEGIKQNIQGLYDEDVVRLQVWLTQRSIAHVYQGVGQADVEIHDQRHDGKRVDDGLVYPGQTAFSLAGWGVGTQKTVRHEDDEIPLTQELGTVVEKSNQVTPTDDKMSVNRKKIETK